jgi:hypothetical protein
MITITRTLNTTSSETYLKKRTVCIPVSFYKSVGRYDSVVININSGWNRITTLNLTCTDMRQLCALTGTVDGDSVYVLNY